MNRTDAMLEAVFLAYAALLSNDEDMRNLVVTETLVKHLIQGLKNQSEKVMVSLGVNEFFGSIEKKVLCLKLFQDSRYTSFT